MIFVTQFVFDQLRDDRRHSTQLGMPKRILAAGLGQEFAAGVFDAFGNDNHAVTIALVSGGYPGDYEKGKVIGGLNKSDHALVFHAGTRQKDQEVLTDGGRVLAVSGKGNSLEEARKQAYAAAAQIKWDGLYYRQDIGQDLLAYKG